MNCMKKMIASLLVLSLVLPLALPVQAAGEDWKDNMLDLDRMKGTALVSGDIHRVLFLDTLAGAPRNSLDVSKKQNGSVLAWIKGQGTAKTLYIAGKGGVNGKEACAQGLSGLKIPYLDFNGCFHMEEIEDISFLFYLSAVRYVNFSGMDLSNIRDMSYLFHKSPITLVDFTGVDTSGLEDMSGMFSDCDYLTSVDLQDLDTGNVTNMSSMFSESENLVRLDLSGWDTSSLTNMNEMFVDCVNLTHLDLSDWDTSKVETFSWIFGRRYEEAEPVDTQYWDLGVWETDSLVEKTVTDFLPKDTQYRGMPWEDLFLPEAETRLRYDYLLNRYSKLRSEANLPGGYNSQFTRMDGGSLIHGIYITGDLIEIAHPTDSRDRITVTCQIKKPTEEKSDTVIAHLYCILQAVDQDFVGKNMEKLVRDWTEEYSPTLRHSRWEKDEISYSWRESGSPRDSFTLEIRYTE